MGTICRSVITRLPSRAVAATRARYYQVEAVSSPPAAFFEAVARDFPTDFMSRDPGDLTGYGRDWTRVHEPAPCAIAFPRTTDEIARVVELCEAHRVAIVPSGGRTGLAAGAVAAKGELVLSLARVRAMNVVDVGCDRLARVSCRS